MLIDFHTHCFPDGLAARAVGSLTERSGLKPCFSGTKDGLLQLMQAEGVDRAVVLNIATNSSQMHKVNDFAIALHEGGLPLYSFGSVHPDAPDIGPELDRLQAAGIRGIKIHPDYIGVFVDDEKMQPIFEGLIQRNMLLLIHAGWDYVSPRLTYATPARIANVLRAYPDLRLICAHMGGVLQWWDAEEMLIGKNVYLDTSFAFSLMETEQATRMLLAHDENKLLFGSDAPWFSPRESLAFLQGLGLPEGLMNKITHENALALLEG